MRRLLLLLPVVLGVLTITFALTSALPVEVQIQAHYGPPPQKGPYAECEYFPTCRPCDTPDCNPCTPTTYACPNPLYVRYTDALGLNQPIPVQWAQSVERSLTFQWGNVANDTGLSNGQYTEWTKALPVTTVIVDVLPYTIELALLALAIILVIAIPLGNLAAVYRNRPIDQGTRVMSFSGYALPAFLLAPLVIFAIVSALGSSIGWFVHSPWCPLGEPPYNEITGSWPAASCFSSAQYPAWMGGGSLAVKTTPTGFPTIDALWAHQWALAFDTLIRMVVPALIIAYGTVALLLRFVRNSMLEVMNLDFIRTARAKGVPERTVVKRHAGRNSLNVTITVLGLTFAAFLGGFAVIEFTFHLNGIGLVLAYAVQANPSPDINTVFGTTIVFTYIVVFANLAVDILYAYLDPRVRLG